MRENKAASYARTRIYWRMIMLASEREKMILEYLASHDIVTAKYLCELTGASIATIRRDLNLLEQRGLLKKTHGGAQSIAPKVYNRYLNPSPDYDSYLDSKEMIAKKASDFISSGDIIFVGAGMTCNLLCKYIAEKENITVVTTNVTAVMELVANPNISILLLGGNVHTGKNHIETLDEYTVQALDKLYFDKVFFTVDGIDLNTGYSIISRAQLPLYNHLISNSKLIYLLADEGKFDKRTFTHLCSLDGIPNIITTPNIPSEYLSYYKEYRIGVFTV